MPLVLSTDHKHLYAEFDVYCGGPGTDSHGIVFSTNGGAGWQTTGEYDAENSFYDWFALSPLSPTRVYAVHSFSQSTALVVSKDGGATWKEAGYGLPASGAGSVCDCVLVTPVVPDPLHLATIYANLTANSGGPGEVTRSVDAGVTWTLVNPPSDPRPLSSFAVSTDPHEPGLLVGQTTDTGIPANRRYLSSDQGKTWKSAACPGTLAGTCPSSILNNVFGARASYAFYTGGIYSFQGAGAAGTRLPISATLPAGSIIDVGAGTKAGDPVYLLVRGSDAIERLYTSTDAGKHWQQLAAAPAPPLAKPTATPVPPPSPMPALTPVRASISSPSLIRWACLTPLPTASPRRGISWGPTRIAAAAATGSCCTGVFDRVVSPAPDPCRAPATHPAGAPRPHR